MVGFMKRKHGTADRPADSDGLMMGKGHKVMPLRSHMSWVAAFFHLLPPTIVVGNTVSLDCPPRSTVDRSVVSHQRCRMPSCAGLADRPGHLQHRGAHLVDRVGHGRRRPGDHPAPVQRDHARDDGLRRIVRPHLVLQPPACLLLPRDYARAPRQC